MVDTWDFDYDLKLVKGERNAGADFMSRCGGEGVPVDQATRDIPKRNYLRAMQIKPKSITSRRPRIVDLPETLSYDRWMREQLNDGNIEALRKVLDADDASRLVNALKEGNAKQNKIRRLYMLDNNLVHLKPANNDCARLLVPENLRAAVCRNVHGVLGHPAARTCYRILKRCFYWRKMKRYIRKFVRACVSCERRKRRPNAKVGLSQFVLANKPFERICIDYLGRRLPKTKEPGCYEYLLVIVDCFTRWPLAIPMKGMSAEELMDRLLEVFYVYGFPKFVHSDNAPTLVNKAVERMYLNLGVKHRTIVTGNPQGNGPVERFNNFLNVMFTIMLPEYTAWDVTVEMILFAFRISPNEATGYSPFFALFGRHPTLPIELTLGNPATTAPVVELAEEQKPEQIHLNDRLNLMVKVFGDIRRMQLNMAKRNQKRLNDSRLKTVTRFKPGDLVIYHNSNESDAGDTEYRIEHQVRGSNQPRKWLNRGSGPHVVTRLADHEMVHIYHTSGQSELLVKANQLRIYVPFKDNLLPEDTPDHQKSVNGKQR